MIEYILIPGEIGWQCKSSMQTGRVEDAGKVQRSKKGQEHYSRSYKPTGKTHKATARRGTPGDEHRGGYENRMWCGNGLLPLSAPLDHSADGGVYTRRWRSRN